MFLDRTVERNPKLIEAAFRLHKNGIIEPDTYILDLDSILENAKQIKEEADKYNVKLYFMTKQFGRNPYISKKLMELGYEGAVTVDFREADILHKNGVKIGHVGHLVQIPSNKIEEILLQKPEVVTVYSYEKAKEISKVAEKLNITQNIMLRIIDKGDILYPAQYGGFYLDELIDVAKKIKELPNIKIYGITSFPCFLFNDQSLKVEKTKNIETLKKAKKILEENLNLDIEQVNTPSATCSSVIKDIAKNGGTHGEPGHGLLGTTPLHARNKEKEVPSIIYVSEISHNLDGKSYCYGGGHYRRSHMENALVGEDIDSSKRFKTITPNNESIDYYLELDKEAKVGQTVVLAFRTQIFVTRSNVAVVKGIQLGNPEIVGLYDAQGNKIR